MSRSNLWPQTNRVAPLPPPMASNKAGRIRKLRRVNQIETDDKGKVQVCKICKEQGHNSRVNARPKQNARPRIRRSLSNSTWRQPQPVMSSATSGIAISVPPPIVGMAARTTFIPPTKTSP
ncbi:hypothetical protein LIER_34524 [Lithospermum erythrorhizon]|uniref:Uncharacterized protein n=1 Tax=Lithospermum erythrorhizon TaxID=34254 RepID=A0AAV3RZR9_LITER